MVKRHFSGCFTAQAFLVPRARIFRSCIVVTGFVRVCRVDATDRSHAGTILRSECSPASPQSCHAYIRHTIALVTVPGAPFSSSSTRYISKPYF